MAEIKTEQEPSIEEILESIRQIISEDGTPVDAAAATAKPKPAAPPPAPAAAKPAAKPAAPVAAPPPAPVKAQPILDLTEKVAPPPAPVKAPPPPAPVAAPQIELEDVPEGEHIISDVTAEAAVEMLAKILASNVSVERELPGRPGNVTLEDMTRELLRPLLREWLDQNLQAIIEKMVRREIERLSALALDK